MLTVSDLIHLPYTTDLTQGGIAYACRFLASSFEHVGPSPLDQLRQMVSGVAVELAFRRFLGEQNVPFEVLREAPFTHLDRYDVSLGRHRCYIKSLLITRRSQILQIRRDAGTLLQAPALVPIDEYTAEDRKPDDLYLFTFVLGLVASAQRDLEKAIAANQPIHLIHPLPEAWTRPRNWRPLEKLALKSECEAPVRVEIGGQDAERNFITAALVLPPRQRMPVEQIFHSLAYIYAQDRPKARIGIHSPVHGEPHIIPAHAWGNLWVYGMEIILAGWLPHEELKRKSRVLNAGAHAFLVDRIRVKNLLISIRELEPITPILEKVKIWDMQEMSRG